MFRRRAVSGPATGYERTAPHRSVGTGAGAGAVGVAGSGLLMLSRLVRLVTLVVVLIVLLGIAFVLLDANTGNSIVSTVNDWAKWLVGPFDGMFNTSSRKLEIGVNWGLATLVYLFAGSLIAGLITRAGLAGRSRVD